MWKNSKRMLLPKCHCKRIWHLFLRVSSLFFLTVTLGGFTTQPIGTIYLDAPIKNLIWNAFSKLVVLRQDGCIEMFDLLDQKRTHFAFPKADYMALDTQTGRYLAFSSGALAYVYDLTSHKLVAQVATRGPIQHLHFQNTDTGLALIAATKQTLKRVWIKDKREDGFSWKGHLGQVAFSPNGCQIIVATTDGTLSLWDGQKTWQLISSKKLKQVTHTIMFIDPKRLLISSGNTLDIWFLPAMNRHEPMHMNKNRQTHLYMPKHKRLLSFPSFYRAALSQSGSIVALAHGKKIEVMKIKLEPPH